MAKTPFKALSDIGALKVQVEAIEECEMMAHYASSQGKKVPPHVLKQLSDLHAISYELELEIKAGNLSAVDPRALNMALIGSLHSELARVIAPASPATVLLMEKNKRKGLFGILGPVPLVRRLNMITMLCLLTFLGLFYSEHVNSYTVNGDILSYNGEAFIFNELVIICIAALGASFYALFEVYKYITNNSYDPKYDSIYWIRFVLGIVSGVILAQFIFVSPEILGENTSELENSLSKSQELGGFMTYKPLLAFLGGFSARVVHKILNSMVEAIETFISGSARDMVAAREEAAKLKMEDKLNSIKQKNAQTEASERMKSTMKLMQLKEELSLGASTQDIEFRLNQMMNEFMQPVGGKDIDFNKGKNSVVQPIADNVPIVEDYNPELEENFDEPIINDAGEEVHVHDVDEIDIPDFPEDMDNPDFPMPEADAAKLKEDFDPNDPSLTV